MRTRQLVALALVCGAAASHAQSPPEPTVYPAAPAGDPSVVPASVTNPALGPRPQDAQLPPPPATNTMGAPPSPKLSQPAPLSPVAVTPDATLRTPGMGRYSNGYLP